MADSASNRVDPDVSVPSNDAGVYYMPRFSEVNLAHVGMYGCCAVSEGERYLCLQGGRLEHGAHTNRLKLLNGCGILRPCYNGRDSSALEGSRAHVTAHLTDC